MQLRRSTRKKIKCSTTAKLTEILHNFMISVTIAVSNA